MSSVTKPKIMTVVGTRPELIKLSLVIKALDRSTNHVLAHTGQNFDYELNEVFFKDLGIRKPDHFLNCARPTAVETIASVMVEVDRVLEKEKPDAVLIYGDTNSALSAIPAKKRQIPIFHMEAGNRSFDQRVPEELNRKIVDHLSDINMTITEHARRYLLDEGLPPERVVKTGSCMPEIFARYRDQIDRSDVLNSLGLKKSQYFLVSTHREENVDRPERLNEIVTALREIHALYQLPVVISTHPRTRKRLDAFGIDLEQEGLTFMKPLGFFDYVQLQKHARCVLSDSGTITEEAGILRFPAITLRDAHERPEGTDAGVLIKAPIKKDAILNAVDVTISRDVNAYDVVADYTLQHVSDTVVAVILSNIDYVNRVVWRKSA